MDNAFHHASIVMAFWIVTTRLTNTAAVSLLQRLQTFTAAQVPYLIFLICASLNLLTSEHGFLNKMFPFCRKSVATLLFYVLALTGGFITK